MTLSEAIRLAERHAPKAGAFRTSAEMCLETARRWVERNPRFAAHWVCRSLSYSISVYSMEYQAARKLLD